MTQNFSPTPLIDNNLEGSFQEKIVEIQSIQEGSLMVFCGIFICVSIIQAIIIYINKKILRDLKRRKTLKGINTSIAKILHKIYFLKL